MNVQLFLILTQQWNIKLRMENDWQWYCTGGQLQSRTTLLILCTQWCNFAQLTSIQIWFHNSWKIAFTQNNDNLKKKKKPLVLHMKIACIYTSFEDDLPLKKPQKNCLANFNFVDNHFLPFVCKWYWFSTSKNFLLQTISFFARANQNCWYILSKKGLLSF